MLLTCTISWSHICARVEVCHWVVTKHSFEVCRVVPITIVQFIFVSVFITLFNTLKNLTKNISTAWECHGLVFMCCAVETQFGPSTPYPDPHTPPPAPSLRNDLLADCVSHPVLTSGPCRKTVTGSQPTIIANSFNSLPSLPEPQKIHTHKHTHIVKLAQPLYQRGKCGNQESQEKWKHLNWSKQRWI